MVGEEDVKIEDAFLKKVNEIIEEHLSEAEYKVPQLSRELGMSHSQLYRKIKALGIEPPAVDGRSRGI